MDSTDLDSAPKSSVETTVARTEHKILSSFFESDPAPSTGVVGNGSMPEVHDDSSVMRFLSRPILISTMSLSVGQVPYLTLDPWSQYLTHNTVKPRISYYARLRADLVLRCNVNGSPMHYGLFRVCYRPHPGGDITSDMVFNHAVAQEASSSPLNMKLVASQLEGFYVNPCRDSSLEMRIPYLHSKPGIELNGVVDPTHIGTLYVIGFAPLLHANGGTTPVTIEFYAHLENITLDVPTVMQQGYTLQDAAGLVRRVIGATARATAIAEEWSPRILSAIAMMGFSRPLSSDVITTVRQIPFNLSNYDAPDTSVPLSLSESAEYTLGGQELGARGDDELVLSRLAARRAYICHAQWATSAAPGTFLVGSIVTPVQAIVSTYVKDPTPAVASYAPVQHTCLTPAAFAAITCKYWRGIVCYRFTVAGSPYHKGRLRIYYDPFPQSWGTNANPSMNITNSVVLDLAETDSVDVEVPWQNVHDVAQCDSPFRQATTSNAMVWAGMCATTDTLHCNGVIVCSVLSPLTSLQGDSLVTVVVEVSVKDLVLYCPRLAHGDDGVPLSMDGAASPYVPQSYDPTGGDAVASLRQLIKRYVVEHEAMQINPLLSTSVTSAFLSYLTFARFPVPGPVANWWEAVDSTSWDEPVNYTGLAFHTYISTAFALVRGGVRWKVSCASRSSPAAGVVPFGVARYAQPVSDLYPSSRRTSVVATLSHSTSLAVLSTRARVGSGWRRGDEGLLLAGDASNPSATCGYLDVQLPFCAVHRAYAPRLKRDALGGDLESDNVRLTCEVGGSAAAGNYSSYVVYEIATAAAEDYNVFGFVHAPAFLSKIPVPAT